MEVFAIPLCILAFAFLMNGFPNIHIGTKKYYKNKKDKYGKKTNV